jgi:hypothetical protein
MTQQAMRTSQRGEEAHSATHNLTMSRWMRLKKKHGPEKSKRTRKRKGKWEVNNVRAGLHTHNLISKSSGCHCGEVGVELPGTFGCGHWARRWPPPVVKTHAGSVLALSPSCCSRWASCRPLSTRMYTQSHFRRCSSFVLPST